MLDDKSSLLRREVILSPQKVVSQEEIDGQIWPQVLLLFLFATLSDDGPFSWQQLAFLTLVEVCQDLKDGCPHL
jgi:hypothetical protein